MIISKSKFNGVHETFEHLKPSIVMKTTSYLNQNGDGHEFEPRPFTNACRHKYMNQKGSAVMLTTLQPAGVALEVNLRNSTQTRRCASKKSTLTLKPRTDKMESFAGSLTP